MVTVAELLASRGAAWHLTVLAGEDALANAISVPRIQKPGLAIAGYLPQIHPERVQVVGNTELGYLATLPPDAAVATVERVCAERVACFIFTNGAPPPAYFVAAAQTYRVPLLATPL